MLGFSANNILALNFQYFRMMYRYLSILLLLTTFSVKSQTFSFTTKNKADHHITSGVSYIENQKFGFDFHTEKDILFSENGATTTAPTYFSVNLPEDNYQISITFCAPEKTSEVTVKAESRRLMVDQLQIPAGTKETVTFNVHLHYTEIDGANYKMELKSREVGILNWDNKLTLEFSEGVTIENINIQPLNSVTTLFLAGDSTVTDQDLEPWASWGQFFTNYINNKAVVGNYASSGASLPSFKGQKRLEKILSELKKGDYVLIEFGHNDEKIKGEGNGAYGLYTNLLKEYITKVRAKGGNPVLLTPTQRRFFENGKLKPTHGDFPNAMRKVAKELNVPLIDLTKLTTDMYESWGDENSRNAFVQYPANTFPGQTEKLEDNTHFNTFGANEIALAIVQEIKNQHLDLVEFLKPNIPNYNPKKPNQIADWTLPMSPRFESEKPYGN